jgi:hypothetical protein
MVENDSKPREWDDLKNKEKRLFQDPDFLKRAIEAGHQKAIKKIIGSMSKECRELALLVLNHVIGKKLLSGAPVTLDIIKETRAELGNTSCFGESKKL